MFSFPLGEACPSVQAGCQSHYRGLTDGAYFRPFPSYPATGRIIHTETSSVQALSLSDNHRNRERSFFLIAEDQITGTRLSMVAEVPEATS